jgi:curved DNA-binding protein CbpA
MMTTPSDHDSGTAAADSITNHSTIVGTATDSNHQQQQQQQEDNFDEKTIQKDKQVLPQEEVDNDNNDDEEDWKVQRDDFKSQGDDAFRRGQYDLACQYYSQALSLDPTHVVLLSNRSAAYLKANSKSKALQDAQLCVQYATTEASIHREFLPKAHSRLAAALWSLGRWQAAKEQYEIILQLDPKNSVANDGVEQCKQQLEKLKEQQQQQQQQKQEEEEQQKMETAQPSNDEQDANGNIPIEKQGGSAAQDNGDEEDDDLLKDFFGQVEAVIKPPQPSPEEAAAAAAAAAAPPAPSIISNQKKDLGSALDQIERLLQPNYAWRNLNPFYVLDLPHTATDEEISQRYKALSLLLHPDKCRHLVKDTERAQEAYDQVQAAKTVLLTNPDKARHVKQLIEQGMKQGKREYYQDQQQAATTSSSITLPRRSLEEFQSIAVQKILAQVEQKRRDVERRKREYEQREREQEDEETAKEKRSRQFDQDWRQEDRMDSRMGNWRDFHTTATAGSNSGEGKKKKKKHKSK